MISTIDRKNNLSEDEFIEEYLKKNQPVIITDGMDNWAQIDKWSPNYLVEHYGDELVQIYDDLFNLTDIGTLKDYIRKYFDRDNSSLVSKDIVPYIRWYSTFKKLDFTWSDNFFDKIQYDWSTPYFIPRNNYILPPKHKDANPTTELFPARGIFISANGACTKTHIDPWSSDAILCQMYGLKKITLYAPVQNNQNLNNRTNIIDVSVMTCKYADFLNAREILFIPHSWPHHVETIENSISITWNFVHISTAKDFLRYLINSPSTDDLDVIKFFLNSI
jgi:hypothetical protein